jgi:hypothetical protein
MEVGVMDKATIKIPKTLYDSLKKQIRGTGFSSVTDFIVYVMRDIAASGKIDQETVLTKEEIQQVRNRLKALGYL